MANTAIFHHENCHKCLYLDRVSDVYGIPWARGTDSSYMSCLQSAMMCPVFHSFHFSAKSLLFRIRTTVSMFTLHVIHDPFCIEWYKNNKLQYTKKKKNGSPFGIFPLLVQLH